MVSKTDFLDRLVTRLGGADTEVLRNYMKALVGEAERFEQVLNEVDEGIILLDAQGTIIWTNRRALEYLGRQRLLRGRSRITELVEEAKVRAFLQLRLRTPRMAACEDFEVLIPRERTLRIRWQPLDVTPRQEILVRIEDVTPEHIQNEGDFRRERNEGLIRLAAGVAHEIGNPLNSIQIYLHLLKRELNKLPKRKMRLFTKGIEVIANETKRLDQIVRNFLRATRRPPLRFRKDALNEILQEAVEFLRPETEKYKVVVSLRLERDLPLFLLDRNRLYESFINLIKNSIEAMPKGGRLEISTVYRGNICIVRFDDEGEGILPEQLPRIFDAYYTTKSQGSGLGLSQVDQSVREHGGRIDVKSEPSNGSVFTLILPMRQERLSLPEPENNVEKKA